MESTGYLQEFPEYIASETGVAFRASLWYKFYLEPDSTAVIAHPSGPDPHVIRLQDVKNLTTSVSGPFGSAATCKFIMDSTVVISWEPASRTWCTFARKGPRMGNSMTSSRMIGVGEWELFAHKTVSRDLIEILEFNRQEEAFHSMNKSAEELMKVWACSSASLWHMWVVDNYGAGSFNIGCGETHIQWFNKVDSLVFQGKNYYMQ